MLGGLLGLALAGGLASAQPLNDNFTNALVLVGPNGSVVGNNTGATRETGEPAHGQPVNSGGASIWHRWTAPADGLIQFDTEGSGIDTLLSVYTGNSLNSLTLVAGNDDVNPANGDFTSQVIFNAVNGTDYFIAVDGFNFGGGADEGQIILNWGSPIAGSGGTNILSGEFQLASGRRNLYVVSENESNFALDPAVAAWSVPARVTVTRLQGANGRVNVDFSVTNLSYTNIFITNYYGTNILITNDIPGTGVFFTNVYLTNVVVTNLFQNYTYYLAQPYHYFPMTFGRFIGVTNENGNITSNSFSIPAPTNFLCVNLTSVTNILSTNPPSTLTIRSNLFCVSTTTTSIDPSAVPNTDYSATSGTLSFDDYQMSADFFVSVFSGPGPHTATYGPATPHVNRVLLITITNAALDPLESTNLSPPTINPILSTALMNVMENDIGGANNFRGRDAFPSEPVINFERATFRINEGGANATVYAVRSGTNVGVAQAGFRIDFGPSANQYNGFPLQAGSDYATPGVDFNSVTGTVAWAANDFNSKPITIPIFDDNLVEFNEDMLLELTPGPNTQVGNINTANLTILAENAIGAEQPAGAADLTHNMDNSASTVPPFMATPGANNSVMALVVQADGKTVIGGDFTGFDSTPRNRIARLNNDGSLDTGFLPSPPNTGANGFVAALASQSDGKIIAGGNFTSFNGNSRNRIVRLSTSGAVDASFNPGLGANATVWSVVLQSDGKILIAGEFTSVGTSTRNYVARLNTNGVVDATFDPGVGPDGIVNTLAVDGTGKIIIGGDFTTVAGQSRLGIARLNSDGTLDPSFNPGAGADGSVYSVATVAGGKVLVGGAFSHVDIRDRRGIARLNSDGSLDTTFDPGDGADNVVYTVTTQSDGKILLGGLFYSINGTRRVGIARLRADGVVDTDFMDTAYNQFAGLPNHYHDPNVINGTLYPIINTRNFVFALGVEASGNIMIGGGFLRVGGGPTRNSMRSRSNVARLVGGSTPGPGNIEFAYDTYSMDENGTFIYVSLVRTNGNLGIIGANFGVNYSPAGPGAASTNDLTLNPLLANPYWNTAWPASWMRSDGTFGPNFGTLPVALGSADVKVTVNDNTNIDGNRTAEFQLATPTGTDLFLLGGENIPLGAALGKRFSTMTIVDNDFKPGTLGFSSPTYSVNEGVTTATINVTRTNGANGAVTIQYATVAGGSATAGSDYTARSGTLTFAPGQTNKTFTVPILDDSTVEFDETINLQLFNPGGGAVAGLTNATLTIVDNDFSAGRLNFSSATYTTNESAHFALVAVTRTGGNLGAVTVQFATSNGTAVTTADYIGVTNTLTWTNNDITPKVVAIPLVDDNLIESNKTVNLRLFGATLNNLSEPQVLGATTNATLTILDDDLRGQVRFTAVTNFINENGGQAFITVVRTGGAAASISVNFSATNGTAVAGIDFTATNGTLVFGPGEVSKTFTVPVTDNISQDLPRFITLSLGSASPTNGLGAPSAAILNIIDNESFNELPGSLDTAYNSGAGFNNAVQTLALQSDGKLLAAGDFTVANGIGRTRIARLNTDGSLDVKFPLGGGTSGADATVRAMLQQTDGRIVVGGDFTNINGIARGRIARLNLDGSLNETFDPGFGTDNPVFAVAETFVGEDRKLLIGGAFTVVSATPRNSIARLNEDGSVDGGFNPVLGANGIVYAIVVQADGKAIIGGDFTSVNGTARNRVARLNPDGSVDLSFDPGTGADGAVRALAIQLDGRIVVGGSFTNFNGSALNRFARLDSSGSLDATFTPGLGADDTVNAIVVQPDTRIILGGQFTRCNGVTRGHLTRLNNDGTVDPSINFGAGANNFIAAAVVQTDGKIIIGGGFTEYDGTPKQRLARIYGGSIAGSGTLEFTSANYSVAENGTNTTITVRRRGGTAGQPLPNNITVNAMTFDGTATNGVHFQGGTTNLVFPPGEVFQSFAIAVVDDFEINPDRMLSLVLTNIAPPGSAALGNQPAATLTIVNDDSAISFSSSTYSRSETSIDGVAIISIVRSGSTLGTSTVDFTTTTNGTATAGLDYTATTNSLVFANGETLKTVTMPILPDSLVEGDETVGLLLTNVGGALLLAPSSATLTIVDDDFAPGKIGFGAAAYSVAENGGSISVTFVRTNGRTGVVSANYFTGDATANAGLDYTAASGAVVFADGETNKTVNIPILDDTLVEGPESFNISLTNATGGATLLAPTTVPVTIVDNDVGITFSSPFYVVGEAGPTVTLTILRLNGSNGVATVNYTTVNGVATAGSDYVTNSGTFTFNNGETIKTLTLSILEDTLVEGDESFSVVLSNPSPGTVLLNGTATVTILDNDTGLAFAPASYIVDEGGTNIVLTVLRTNANTGTVTVSYGSTNGTATAGADYGAVAGVLTFTNGESLKTITIPIVDDTQVEGDENFTVTLLNPTGGAQFIGPSVASVTIVDNDAGLAFSSATYAVLESGVSATITVIRSGITNSIVGVNYSTSDGTATNGSDYVSASGTLTFTNGEIVKTFIVSVIDDTIEEGAESVLLKLTGPTGQASLLNPNAATLTIVDNDGSLILPAGVLLTAESGIVNGAIEPGETVTALFAMRNVSGFDTTNLVATLLDTNGVTVVTSPPWSRSNSYGAMLNGGASVSRAFRFTASGTNGGSVAATFQLSDGGVSYGRATFNFLLGTQTGTFSNLTTITINDLTSATPYPSVISVSGLGGSVSKVTMTLTNLAHTHPNDIDMLLAGPGGQKMLPMSDTGGGNTITNVTLTLDDAAASPLPFSGTITSGTNQPTNFLLGDFFHSPAPPSPYSNNFATFNGGNPNGAWSLFLEDDSGFDTGLVRGWYLTITTAGTVPAAADLSVTMTGSPNPVVVGSNLVYTILVTNHGPWSASGIVLTDTLPANTVLVSTSPTSGVATNVAGLVTWTIGTLPKDGVTSLTITVQPTLAGTISNSATALATETDPNVANNTATVNTAVVNPTADLAMSIIGSPNPVFFGQNLTYSLTVSNGGPATATGVTITNTLPPGVTFVSATPAGSYTLVGSVVTFTNLGAVGNGSVVNASITIHPNSGTQLTNTATCGSAVTDPLKGNNTATVKTVIEYPAMSAAASGGNLVISWPSGATGYNLEYTLSLAAPVVWTPLTNPPPSVLGGTKTVTLGIGGGNKFFRLHATLP